MSRIQVQTEWNVSALIDFCLFFSKCARYISRLSEEDGSKETRKLQTGVIEMERDAILSPVFGEAEISARSPSAASAAIPARDLTFTVTQGNQLRNKLSFYRILNRVLPRRGRAWKLKDRREASLPLCPPPPPPRKEKFHATGRNCSSRVFVARDQRASRTTDREITLMSYCSFFEIVSLSRCIC